MRTSKIMQQHIATTINTMIRNGRKFELLKAKTIKKTTNNRISTNL